MKIVISACELSSQVLEGLKNKKIVNFFIIDSTDNFPLMQTVGEYSDLGISIMKRHNINCHFHIFERLFVPFRFYKREEKEFVFNHLPLLITPGTLPRKYAYNDFKSCAGCVVPKGKKFSNSKHILKINIRKE